MDKNNMFTDTKVAKKLDKEKNKLDLQMIEMCKQELSQLDQ